MTLEELKKKSLKLVLLAQLTVEANDDVKGSTLYKAKLKVFGRQFVNQLAPAIRQTDEMYRVNPTMYTNLTRNIEELVEKLAEMDTHDLVMINQIHDHYKDNKEDWDNMFGIELQKLKE